MRASRLWCGWIWAIVAVSGVQAQPEEAVRSAVTRLLEAENYSWQGAKGVFFDPLKRNTMIRPTGSGETVIGGYTAAMFRKRAVVQLGSESAINLSDGWTLVRLLSEEQAEELGRLQMSLPSGTPWRALDNS